MPKECLSSRFLVSTAKIVCRVRRGRKGGGVTNHFGIELFSSFSGSGGPEAARSSQCSSSSGSRKVNRRQAGKAVYRGSSEVTRCEREEAAKDILGSRTISIWKVRLRLKREKKDL